MALEAGQRPGTMEVHVHDSPCQPILVSRKALRALGAVLDFGQNEVIYKNVDPKMVVPLQEAANGHLLMPMTGNITEGGSSRSTPFQSLRHE